MGLAHFYNPLPFCITLTIWLVYNLSPEDFVSSANEAGQKHDGHRQSGPPEIIWKANAG